MGISLQLRKKKQMSLQLRVLLGGLNVNDEWVEIAIIQSNNS